MVLYCTRHTAGTKLVKEAGEIAASNVLGHATLTMTKRYAHLAAEDLADAADVLG